MATTTYTMTCLSPVHIGTGTQFSKFDGVYHDGQWHYIDLDKVLTHGVNANELARAMSNRDFSWATWLRDRSVVPSNVTTYTLPCPQDPEETPIREAMKNVHEQAYLPGSSVKGAIRTAILWSLLKRDSRLFQSVEDYIALRLHSFELLQALDRMEGGNRKYSDPQSHERAVAQTFGNERAKALCDVLHRALSKRVDRLQRSDFERFAEWNWRRNRVEPNPRSVDDPIERFAMGINPNHDLMRAMQVSDTEPASLGCLAVGLVWTYTLRGNRLGEKREQDGEYKALVEWLAPGTTLQLSFRIDDFLFSNTADRDLHFRGAKEQAVRQVAHTCNAYARAITASEKAFYTKYSLDALRDFYSDLEMTSDGLPEGVFLLNIGWGSGWEIKTVGDLLRTRLGADDFKQLRQRYRLGENPKTHQIDLDGLFPHTRRIAYEGGAPMWPMGWMKLTPEER